MTGRKLEFILFEKLTFHIQEILPLEICLLLQLDAYSFDNDNATSPWKFLQIDDIYCVLLLFYVKRDQMI